jgi:hypothetical protein
MGALVYNWWNLFVRCAEPERAREAITSRPMLLHAVGRLIKSGGQTTLRLTSHHAEASHIQSVLSKLSLFLSGLINAAEQLPSQEALAADLAPHPGTLSTAGGGLSATQRLKSSVEAQKNQIRRAVSGFF